MKETFSWLIEDGDSDVSSPRYCTLIVNASLMTPGSGPWFRLDTMSALRFGRETDARVFAEWAFGKDHGHRIREHGWIGE